MLFLVKGVVTRVWYPDSDGEDKEETRLVDADNEGQARAKFIALFEDQSEEYAVSYSVNDVVAHGVVR